jgi:hypothetical protein
MKAASFVKSLEFTWLTYLIHVTNVFTNLQFKLESHLFNCLIIFIKARSVNRIAPHLDPVTQHGTTVTRKAGREGKYMSFFLHSIARYI